MFDFSVLMGLMGGAAHFRPAGWMLRRTLKSHSALVFESVLALPESKHTVFALLMAAEQPNNLKASRRSSQQTTAFSQFQPRENVVHGVSISGSRTAFFKFQGG
jgi:hypothetical protein